MSIIINTLLSIIFAFNFNTYSLSGNLLSLQDCQNLYPESDLSLFVYDLESEFELLNNKGDLVRPIASLTKLMTALVFLDTQIDWQSLYTITREDSVSGGRLNLFLGDTVTIEQLFKTALIASDNGASLALVRSTGISQEEFVKRMNDKAQEFGLLNTYFADVTGLSNDNVSNAQEIAYLAKYAFQREEIREALSSVQYNYTSVEGREKMISSTLDLLRYDGDDLKYLVGKTGYTNEAGYCLVSIFSQAENQLITVVLGAIERPDRNTISLDLARWHYNNCPL